MSKKKLGVFIGRFQPFHNGHASVIDLIDKECDYGLVVIGSINRAVSIKNPFTYSEVEFMIREYASYTCNNIELIVTGVADNLYKEWTWKKSVVDEVETAKNALSTYDDMEVVLYGHFRDDSSYYLREFPEWLLREVPELENGISANDIRTSMFQREETYKYLCPTPRFIEDATYYSRWVDLTEEFDYYQKEAAKFSSYPYPETLGFMCADAVVVCQGFVLLVERKHAPGKGVWALPGGFKNSNETFQETALRELTEETNLRVPVKVLTGSIRGSRMFDSPRRSIGIPRVTMAYHIEVAPNFDGSLPEVRPSSDAMAARWVPFQEILGMKLYDDHSDIINYFI
jgi:bifunctional NMN adenylyltransferase/nudix hydrolase